MKNWFTDQSILHPLRTIIVSVILTVVLGFGLRWLVVEDDLMKLLPQEIESRVSWDEINDEFGSTDIIFTAIGKPGESIYNPDLLRLIYDISNALEALPIVDEVMSLATMDRMDSDEGFIDINDLMPGRNMSDEEIQSLQAYLDVNPDMKVRLIGKHNDFTNVIIRPFTDVNMDDFRNSVVDTVAGLQEDYEVHYGGHAYLTGTVPMLIREDVMNLMRAGMLIMVLILLANLRSAAGVGMVLTVIFLSLVAMLGLMGWLTRLTGSDSFYFSMMTTSMPIILLTIANSDGVHILTKFFREFRRTKNKEAAVRQTMGSLSLPVFLTSITTVAAFLTMITSPITAMLGFGVCMAMGISWAWLLSISLLPSLIMVKNWKLSSRAIANTSLFEKLIDKFGGIIVKYPKRILVIGLGLVVIGIFGIFLVQVEVNLVSFFKPEAEIRQSIEFIDREMTGTMDLEMMVSGDLKDPGVLSAIDEIQDMLEEHPAVSTTISIVDVIKQMHRTVMDDDPRFETVPDSRDKVNNLFTLYSMSGDPDDFSSLVDYDYERGLVTALMSTIPTSEIVPFVEHIDAYAREVAEDRFEMTITGMLVVIRDMVHLIITSSLLGIIASIIVIFLIIWIFFKRAVWGLLSVLPLASAVILNFGLMGLFGVDLSHVTALLSSIIIGVGVDFAIHYISQYRALLKQRHPVDRITTEVVNDVGYPIVLDAASNMGFAALLFSVFLPIQFIGGLMVFAMISTSVGTLTLLASITEISKKKLETITRD